MSTICKIALTAQSDLVIRTIEAFLRQRDMNFDLTKTEWPAANERDVFIVGRDFPSIFSIKQVTSEVTEIHFNSFATLEDLASFLSRATGANVVVNLYQSVSSASYWAFYEAGKQRRTVEGAESTARLHTGDRLPFEGTEPGRPREDDPEFFFFDSDEQDWYNREVGVPVEVYENYEAGWINFMLTGHNR